MVRTYCTHNEVYRYWRIECISTPYPNASGDFVFKGKTLDGAIKAAQKYCNDYNRINSRSGQTMKIGDVLYECDYYRKKVNA